MFSRLRVFFCGVLWLAVTALAQDAGTIQPLRIVGENYVDPAGKAVRFWGVNTVSLFPTHEQAEVIADYLAGLGVNLVRPHHMQRPSTDWVVKSKSIAMSLYKDDTRTRNEEAWDRLDYFNAALRKRGIYLQLSLHQSREFRPGDAGILDEDKEDTAAWRAAIDELNKRDWKKKIDPIKLLPAVDRRALLLQQEFTRDLLEHVNPYTGVAYGKDPQVISIEVVNEATCEYIFVCNNTYPEYFAQRIQAKWREYAKANGIEEPGDMYKVSGENALRVRAEFYRSLDREYYRSMRDFVRGLGCNIPMLYTNLPYSEATRKMQQEMSEVIETHSYANPRVAFQNSDLFNSFARTNINGKPLIVGEFNMSEWGEDVNAQKPYRTMLQLAGSAYGGLHNLSGIVWFSWQHGDVHMGEDGLAKDGEARKDNLGNLMCDGMLLDHMRTAGMIFRLGLAKSSVSPIVVTVDDPLPAGDYHAMLRNKYDIVPGWQSIHGVRRAYGPRPEDEAGKPWFDTQTPPANPLVSDTAEITKDTARKQLIFSAPLAEGFSGHFDAEALAGLKHLRFSAKEGFATVMLVSKQDAPLVQSQHLILSRTYLDSKAKEGDTPIRLAGLSKAENGRKWMIRPTRPRIAADLLRSFTGTDKVELRYDEAGELVLPVSGWNECEITQE